MKIAILSLAVYSALITGSIVGYTLKCYLDWTTRSVPVAVGADGLYMIDESMVK